MFKLSIFLLFLLPAVVVAQKNAGKNELTLEKDILLIQKKLKVLKNKLNKAYGEEHIILKKLEQQDKAINDLSKEISVSKKQLKSINEQIEQITQNIDTKSHSIDQQKQQIIDLVTLQVYLNHDKTLKMLLVNPQNNNSIQTKHQIKYLQNRLFNLIKEVALQIKDLEVLNDQQLQLQQEEDLKQQGLLFQQDKLLDQRQQRLVILKRLKVEISKHKTQSDNLNKDQQRLQQLLSEIQTLLSDLPADLGSNKPFRKLKGQMQKPVKGAYIRSFKSRRSENTKWNGVVIKANMGDNVKAIAYGRVAFADWLRGFGMLIILDHQDGYMSLYGFNESISVEVGDWVDKNHDIATIGNSGTLATPGVYFEIRKDAKPLNPKAWVK